ncbi:MAG TPA: UDP-N-acetylmuramoylalanyl-D-glutamyl-2,6-diaminopimelate--D-alanyl-D-alanine ligase [Rhizomicrobium sp.]|jgi:UDP-N-acetylmuramoyl-tripeptide--D-alanyl-D-alanine ligase|nr:UDP-N-acetylmuramoylalanyl-D-glutamyl-2,6-diaminopimelate--D-alanyl-D-alanine ligase [Rhizomicrobium sp.]
MSGLWTSVEAEAATLGRASVPFTATGMSIDTRTLKPGDMFVALKGEARDGHAFVRAALDAQASAALVSHVPEGLGESAPVLTVANTLRGLEDLARASHARSHAKIIAVTGSAGKTTTKEMLRLACGALGSTHASAASHNNHWGVPLSLASMPREAEFGIFEIGMNHFGEIRSLVSFVRPHVALITTIAPAHLEFFGSCEAIADAKSEIFEGIVPGGAAAIPADSAYAERLRARAKQANAGHILAFGKLASADARLVSIEDSADGMRIEAEVLGRDVHFRLQASGTHLATNALGALLAVAAADGDVLNAAAALSGFTALKGRGARSRIDFRGGTIELIDESYNANPASMAAALDVLSRSEPAFGGRRVAVLGDMLELGANGPSLHAALEKDIEDARADLVFVAGPLMQALWEALPASRRGAYAETSAALAPQVLKAVRAGDVVLVKASNGLRMSHIVDALKAGEKGGAA